MSSYTGSIMHLLTTLSPGDSFHTEIKPNTVVSYAKLNKVKVNTSQCLVVENYTKQNPKTIKLTKVTILD